MRLSAIDGILLQARRPYRAISVQPISPVIGAEIEGLDLQAEPSGDQLEELRRAFLEHHVLVFHGQSITPARQSRLAALLGGSPDSGRQPSPGAAEIQPAEPAILSETWRADETYRSAPPAGAVLHLHRGQGPGAGGDMLFGNMHLAYELLSKQLKSLLADLTAVHAPDPGTDPLADSGMAAEHPVVVRHPATGHPALFVNRAHTSRIVQLDREDSEMTLDVLYRHLEAKPVLTCRIRWARDAVVVWDNRSTQHLMLQDFSPGSVSGRMVSMAGEHPEPLDA